MDMRRQQFSPAMLKRTPFTRAQNAEAQELGFVTEHDRENRRRVVTHAIDDVAPSVQADRDDGIYVSLDAQSDKNGIETTIADVAGHVPLSTSLAKVAHERGFTEYRPHANDPMFPKLLEDRMSLEHGQERLGLTIKTENDAQLNTTYLEFERTVSVPDNVDYAGAAQRMRVDPQFMRMKEIGQGLRARMKQIAPLAVAEQDARRKTRPLSATDMQATKMVEAYMLKANADVSSFFARANLPFIYRNFEDENIDADGIPRAFYCVRSKGHAALRREGLVGDYGHVTSPIRRGPDFYNAHMMHYVIDGVESLEQQLLQHFPSLDHQHLHHELWRMAAELFNLQSQTTRTPSRTVARAMEEKLAALLPKHHQDNAVLREIARGFLATKPPLTVSQLDRYVLRINALVAVEKRAMQDPELKRYEAQRRHAKDAESDRQGMEVLTAEDFTKEPDNEFTNILGRAARIGWMNDTLSAEISRRVQASIGQEAIAPRSLTQMAFNILIVAPRSSEWLELKRSVCSAIKNSPEIVNGVLQLAQHTGYMDASLLHYPKSNIITNPAQEGRRAESLEARLVAYGKPPVAPPFYSVGHDERSAKSHALYSFIEHWAFGELRPIQQSNIPNLLYADLDHPDADRRAIVEKMAQSIGANLKMITYERDGVQYLRARVKGGQLKIPIIAQANSNETGNLEAVAMKRLLRLEAFKNAMNYSQLAEAQALLKPTLLARKMLVADDRNWRESLEPVRKRGGGSQFRYQFTVGSQPIETTFSDIGPNVDRARNGAAGKLLRSLGLGNETKAPHAKSWAGDVDAQVQPNKSAER